MESDDYDFPVDPPGTHKDAMALPAQYRHMLYLTLIFAGTHTHAHTHIVYIHTCMHATCEV
jgi:hypothetical protein